MNDQIKAPDTLLPTLMKRIKLNDSAKQQLETEKSKHKDLLHSSHWQDRVKALHELTDVDGLEPLLAALNDTDESVRVAAIQKISSEAKNVPVQRFCELLERDPSSLVREAALIALSMQPSIEVRQHLSNAQYDPSEIVRMAAQQVVQNMILEEKQEAVNDSEEKSLDLKEEVMAGQALPHFLPDRRQSKRRRIFTIMSVLAATVILMSTVSIFLVKQPDNSASIGTPLWKETFGDMWNPATADQAYWDYDNTRYFFVNGRDQLEWFDTFDRQRGKYTNVDPAKSPLVSAGFTTWHSSRRGKYVVMIAYDTKLSTQILSIWSLSIQQRLLEYKYKEKLERPGLVPQISWNRDETRMALVDNGRVITWDLTSIGSQRVIENDFGKISEDIALSVNGRYIALYTYKGTVEVWDVQSGKRVFSKFVSVSINNMSFSSDNKQLAVTTDEETYVIDIQTGAILIRVASGYESLVYAWSADKQYLVTLGKDATEQYSVIIWRISTGQRIQKVVVLDKTPAMVSPDGRYIALTTRDYKTQIWEINTGRLVAAFNEMIVPGIHFWSPNSKYLATQLQDRTVAIWDVSKGERVLKIDNVLGVVSYVDWSSDMQYIVVRSSRVERKEENGVKTEKVLDSTIALWKWPLTK